MIHGNVSNSKLSAFSFQRPLYRIFDPNSPPWDRNSHITCVTQIARPKSNSDQSRTSSSNVDLDWKDEILKTYMLMDYDTLDLPCWSLFLVLAATGGEISTTLSSSSFSWLSKGLNLFYLLEGLELIIIIILESKFEVLNKIRLIELSIITRCVLDWRLCIYYRYSEAD